MVRLTNDALWEAFYEIKDTMGNETLLLELAKWSGNAELQDFLVEHLGRYYDFDIDENGQVTWNS